MWVPTCYGDPGKVSDAEYKCSTDDQGGVHGNSGVPNHGYALLVDGGTYNGTTVEGIGLTKAAHIWWQAQSQLPDPGERLPGHGGRAGASCADLIDKELTDSATRRTTRPSPTRSSTPATVTRSRRWRPRWSCEEPATQCNFGPLLKPDTPASNCGAGTKTKSAFSETFEDELSGWSTVVAVPSSPEASRPWEFTASLPAGNKPAGSTGAAFGPARNGGRATGAPVTSPASTT